MRKFVVTPPWGSFGTKYTAATPLAAALDYARERQSSYGNVPVGVITVQDLETREVTRWVLASHTAFAAVEVGDK